VRAAQAVLGTLAERITRETALALVERLPAEVGPWLHTEARRAEPFDVDEFVRRIAEREGVDAETAERHARVVLSVLRQAVGADEFRDMEAELSKDYAPLLPLGPYVDPLPARVFLGKVARRAGIDEEAARRATEALLETLAERISAGEVRNLLVRLPVALHEPLKRGTARSDGSARRMRVDRFLARVAQREGVPRSVAREHARAVFATLREVVSDAEFFDMASQLPDEYRPLMARP